MDSLILVKIIVKISFPNQAFVDFNVAMKKPSLRRVTWDLNSSVLWLTIWGGCPGRTLAALQVHSTTLSFSLQVHHVLESFDSSNSPYDKNYLNSRFIQKWGNVKSVILSHDPYDPAHAIPYKTITRAACIGPDGLTWAGPEKRPSGPALAMLCCKILKDWPSYIVNKYIIFFCGKRFEFTKGSFLIHIV